MAGQPRIKAGLSALILVALLGPAPSASAAVVVFDRVTSVGKPVFVKVVTRGLLFTQGGRRVAIRIDNRPVYDTLSGGDGAAYMKYHPDKPGFYPVTAVSENEEGFGTVLVLAPGESVIVIGVEGGLQKSLFSEEERQTTREVVDWLSQKYRLVYLTRWFGVGLVKDWLKKQQFPQSVVVSWRGESVFKRMKNNGVRVTAVIGSGTLLQAAPDSIEKRFTFDENGSAAVSGWEQIRKALGGGTGHTDRPASEQKTSPPKP